MDDVSAPVNPVRNLDELRALAQPLTGATGGARTLSFYFGPTDLIELLDQLDQIQAESDAKGKDANRLAACLVWLANECNLSTSEHREVEAVLAQREAAIASFQPAAVSVFTAVEPAKDGEQ